MRQFNYKQEYLKLLTQDVLSLVSQIREFKGRQDIFLSTSQSNVLEGLIENAKIQSTEASNRIEGIVTTKERIKGLACNKILPKTRDEKEIAGYRDVLSTIHENYNYMSFKDSVILQLHRDLYKFNPSTSAGKFKNSDNVISELRDGVEYIRFKPVPAWQTPSAIKELCNEAEALLDDEKFDSLILIPIIILDFLCIHPFSDGNGRMSRLLTLLLLYKAGFLVGKYISIERLIADTKDNYYASLEECSCNWHEGSNTYLSFVKYTLEVIVAAYKDFEERAVGVARAKLNKKERIEKVIKDNIGTITKSKILELCPDISKITIERALDELKKDGKISQIGSGRYTKYVQNYES